MRNYVSKGFFLTWRAAIFWVVVVKFSAHFILRGAPKENLFIFIGLHLLYQLYKTDASIFKTCTEYLGSKRPCAAVLITPSLLHW